MPDLGSIALLLLCLYPILTGGMPGDGDDAASVLFSEGGESMTRAGGVLAGLAVSVATFKTCRLCNARSDSESPMHSHPGDAWGGYRPWLHYKRVVELGREMKEASGKICAICHRVFDMSSLKVTHGSMAAYISWRNSGDSQARHAAFMRGLRSYISSRNRGDGSLHTRPFHSIPFCFCVWFNCVLHFAIIRDELSQVVTVDTHETRGLRQKENLVFIEMEDWKKANPGKVPPAAAIDKIAVLQKDGTTAIKEGVMEGLDKQGHHNFERYSDRGVTTKRNLHNSSQASLGEGHAEDMHAAAHAQLRIARPMSLEELSGLAVTEDVEPTNEVSEESDGDNSEGVDDDRAQRQCSERARPLFSFRPVAAPKAAASGGGGGGKPQAAASGAGGRPQAAASGAGGKPRPQQSAPAQSPAPSQPSKPIKPQSVASGDGDLDDQDLDVGTVDGRAERLKSNFKRDIQPLKEQIDGVRDFDAIDVESYLGFGDVFKTAIRHWQKSAKDIERAIKVLERKIEATKTPTVYAHEIEQAESLSAVCIAIVEITRTLLSSQASVLHLFVAIL